MWCAPVIPHVRSTYLIVAGLLIAGTVACMNVVRADAGQPPSKPNIILVFIDDMGWADFSCFGNKDAATPHIDALAEEGIAFEQFYVNSPVCSPSRVSISTGMYPNVGVSRAIWPLAGRTRHSGCRDWLDPKAPMLARSLKEAATQRGTSASGTWVGSAM